MVSEDSNVTPNENDGKTYSCDTTTYDYKTDESTCEDTQSEKLYTNPDEPSDELVKQPLEDDTNQTINVTLNNIDYDISDPENLSAEDEELLSNLPNEITITLALNELPQEGDIDKYILNAASEQSSLPIKNAEITNVSMDLIPEKEESINEAENEKYSSFNTYGFVNGMNKLLQSFNSKEDAIKAAEDFSKENENEENFQAIVVGVDKNNFEDFDKLLYKYPESDFENYEELEDESLEEEIQEPLSSEILDCILDNDLTCKFWNDNEEPVIGKLLRVWDREVHSTPYETEEHQFFQHVEPIIEDEENVEDVENDMSAYASEELPDSRDYDLEDTLAMYHNAGIDG